jgi:lysophospholipase L1-like esterase
VPDKPSKASGECAAGRPGGESTAGAAGAGPAGAADQASYPGEAADPHCLRAGEAARLLAGHPWHRFVVVGDSIAAGLGESRPGYPDQPWCDRVAAELRRQQPDLVYLNLGSANTPVAIVAARQLGPALAFEPDLALAACGGYDILLPRYDPAQTEAQLRAIVSALAASGCDVVTAGMFDGSRGPAVPGWLRPRMRERLHDLSRRTRALSAELGALHVELTWHPASGDADIYSKDARHGTMRGHAISAAETIRRLGSHLGGAANGPAGPDRTGQDRAGAGRAGTGRAGTGRPVAGHGSA